MVTTAKVFMMTNSVINEKGNEVSGRRGGLGLLSRSERVSKLTNERVSVS